ncbi:MAG: response regulator [Acidobacteria bacterium]|nr:response regulator [Acidobacteriota bacterium]
MDREKLIERLMATYLAEVEEHVRALNRDLLVLEKETTPEVLTGLLATLFRTAHSLKGASHSVSVTLIESACHRLEEILAGLRDRQLPMTPDLVQLLFATADAIEEAGNRLRNKKDLADAPLARLLTRLDAAAATQGPGQSEPTEAVQPVVVALTPSAGSDIVRVQAAKLDTLIARSGELLVARRRTEAWSEDLLALREFVEGWEREWRPAGRFMRRSVLRKGDRIAPPPERRGNGGYAEGLPRQARQALGRAEANLKRLHRELDRLATGAAADRHMLDQAASPLEEGVRRLRMLPFGESCESLPRTVRDLAKAARKEVDLVIEGGAVELDRAILERLKDPLLHLVRNSLDHGIELPGDRQRAGKAPRGRITVSASVKGSRVEIAVEDDGKGLDLAAIREQQRRRKLPESTSDQDAARAVFLPGLSTAKIITQVSGRGIGLDVVKHGVESVHGTVDLEFDVGRRTRFVLNVPLTLSTLRGLLVATGGLTFAFSDTNVRALLRVRPDEIRSIEGREVVLMGGVPIPLAALGEVLGLAAREPTRVGGKVPIVVLASGNSQAAFVVDELLSEQEIVVVGLGARLIRVRNVSGATILPTGRVALILNAADLVRTALTHVPARGVAERLAEPVAATRKLLLVVDDSVTTRSLEKSILEASGYDVLAAADGAEAWEILQERGADMVVSDIEMPRMDGFVLTEAIRGSKRFRDLPVVLVTALESEKDKARGIEVGADAYLLKSAFDQRDLLQTIAQLV